MSNTRVRILLAAGRPSDEFAEFMRRAVDGGYEYVSYHNLEGEAKLPEEVALDIAFRATAAKAAGKDPVLYLVHAMNTESFGIADEIDEVLSSYAEKCFPDGDGFVVEMGCASVDSALHSSGWFRKMVLSVVNAYAEAALMPLCQRMSSSEEQEKFIKTFATLSTQ